MEEEDLIQQLVNETNAQKTEKKPTVSEDDLINSLVEDTKKKSQSQSGSSTEKSSLDTSEQKKEQSSGTGEQFKFKLGSLSDVAREKAESVKAPRNKEEAKAAALERAKQQGIKSSEVDKEKLARERELKQGIELTRESEKQKTQEEKSGAQIQQEQELAKQTGFLQSNFKPLEKFVDEGYKPKVTDEVLKLAFDGKMDDLLEKGFSEEDLDKLASEYISKNATKDKNNDIRETIGLMNKFQPAPEDFKEGIGISYNPQTILEAKNLNFKKVRDLAFKVADFDDDDLKVINAYSDVMNRLNAFRSKSAEQQKQAKGTEGSMVIKEKEYAQFAKDLEEYKALSKQIADIRGNNNVLFNDLAELVIKENPNAKISQEAIVKPYKNDYMKLQQALEDATYKLNFIEKKRAEILEKDKNSNKMSNEYLDNFTGQMKTIQKQKNLAELEVLALSNALFLNEDITKKLKPTSDSTTDKVFNEVGKFFSGAGAGVKSELFGEKSLGEANQARELVTQLESLGIKVDKETQENIKPGLSELFGETIGTSTVLGAKIAAISYATSGVGALGEGIAGTKRLYDLYKSSKIFKNVVDITANGLAFELASDETSFAMGVGEDIGQKLFTAATRKLKPLNKLVEVLTKTLVGATSITAEEYIGDFSNEFFTEGNDIETAIRNTLGSTEEEALQKFVLTFGMGMMSGGKQGTILMIGALKGARETNPQSDVVKEMEKIVEGAISDPDKFVEELKEEAKTTTQRVYPDKKGGNIKASEITLEEEVAIRKDLGMPELSQTELEITRKVKEDGANVLPTDSPYTNATELENDIAILKGESEVNNQVPQTYVGETIQTNEGNVTTVTETVEEGTQLRIPLSQLSVQDTEITLDSKFDREKGGVVDVWQDPKTNEIFVVNGNKRVLSAKESGLNSIDVNFVKANNLEEAVKLGEQKNVLDNTKTPVEAMEVVNANPELKSSLDLNKLEQREVFGLSELNDELTAEVVKNPSEAKLLSAIGNKFPKEQQSEVYKVAKENNLTSEEVAQLDDVKKITKAKVKADIVSRSGNILSGITKTPNGKVILDAIGVTETEKGLSKNEEKKKAFFERVAQVSPTINKLTEKYAQLVEDGIFTVKEASNRLVSEIKDNIDEISSEINLEQTAKDIKVLENLIQQASKTKSSDALRKLADEFDEMSKQVFKRNFIALTPFDPIIASLFLKILSKSLKLTANIQDAIVDAIEKLKKTKSFQKYTSAEQSDIINKIKNDSNALIDLAKKRSDLFDSLKDNTYASSFGIKPNIVRSFLKVLTTSLRLTTNNQDAIINAIEKLKKTEQFENFTTTEQADIINKIKSNSNVFIDLANKKNAIGDKKQKQLEKNVSDKIKYIYKHSLTSLPTIKAIQKLAEKSGIDPDNIKSFSKKLYVELQGFEKTRYINLAKTNDSIESMLTGSGKSIKSFFNDLTTLILKDKTSATILSNMFVDAFNNFKSKGKIKITPAQLGQITNAIQKADLSNLSGIYELNNVIEKIIQKESFRATVSSVKDLQKSLNKLIKKDTPVKLRNLIKGLIDINPNQITTATAEKMYDSLVELKDSIKANDNFKDLNNYQTLLRDALNEQEDFLKEKENRINEQRYKAFLDANPYSTLGIDEYLEFEKPIEDEAILMEKAKSREEKKNEKREELEMLSEYNMIDLIDFIPDPNTTPIIKREYAKLVELLKEIRENTEKQQNNEEFEGMTLSDVSDNTLMMLNKIHAEVLQNGSYSMLGTFARTLSGENKAFKNKDLIKNSLRQFNNTIKKIFSPDKTFNIKTMSFTQFVNRVFVGQRANEISALLFAELNEGINNAKREYKKFNDKLVLLTENNLFRSENFDLGLKSFLLSSPEGTIEEKQELFEAKKRQIERDLEALKRVVETTTNTSIKNNAKQRIKFYQESLNNVAQLDTYEDYVQAYEDGKLFNAKQKAVFDLLRSEYNKQEPQLESSNELHGSKEFIKQNYYTTTSYTSSREAKQVNKDDFNKRTITKKKLDTSQAGSVFEKLNPDSIPDNNILDFNFIEINSKRVLENYFDVFTLSSRIESKAMLYSDSFRDNFNGRDYLYYNFVQRVIDFVHNETDIRRGSLDTSRGTLEKVYNMIGKIKKSVLNRPGQFLKQPTVLVHTATRFPVGTGKALMLYFDNITSKEGRELLDLAIEGSDSINRAPLGDEQLQEAMSKNKISKLSEKQIVNIIKDIYANEVKKPLLVGDVEMVTSDIYANDVTYLAALIDTIEKDGNTVDSMEALLKHKDSRNTYIADRLTASINNESSTEKQGEFFSSKGNANMSKKLMVQLFYMFQSHAANASHNATTAMIDLFDSNSTYKDREIALKNIVGYVGALYAFHAASILVSEMTKSLYDKLLDLLFDSEMPAKDDKEEKKRQEAIYEDYSAFVTTNVAADLVGGKSPSMIREGAVAVGTGVRKLIYKITEGKDFEGATPYQGDWKELGGVFTILTDGLSDVNKASSTYILKRNANDIIEAIDFHALAAERIKNFPTKESMFSLLNVGFKLSGMGAPAAFTTRAEEVMEKEKEYNRERMIDFIDVFSGKKLE